MIKHLIDDGYPLTAQYYVGVCGLASKLSHKYGRSEVEEDFVQVALATACKAELRYNPQAGASFYTYINKIIKSEIQKAFGNPNRYTKKYKTIQKFIDEFGRSNTRYPDIQEISKGTGLSRFDILSIYYDRYREQSLDSSLDEGLMSDPFQDKDFSWVTEHLDVLTKEEALLIEVMYSQEVPMATVASAMGITVSAVKALHDSALEKLKSSIKDYQ